MARLPKPLRLILSDKRIEEFGAGTAPAEYKVVDKQYDKRSIFPGRRVKIVRSRFGRAIFSGIISAVQIKLFTALPEQARQYLLEQYKTDLSDKVIIIFDIKIDR